MDAGAAATQTTQTRRRGAGQQDSPYGLGDDEERRDVSASVRRSWCGGSMIRLIHVTAQTSRNAMEWNQTMPRPSIGETPTIGALGSNAGTTQSPRAVQLQTEYADWLDALPDKQQDSALADALRAVIE